MNEIAKMGAFAPSRRAFLQGGAAGLVVGFTLGAGPNEALAGAGSTINAYVQIAADDTVTIYVGATEMGQGIMTGIAQLVAEELKLDPAKWSKVRVEHGLVTPATTPGSIKTAPFSKPASYKSQSTGGSTSMRSWFTPMRQAGAAARVALVDAYAKLAGNGAPLASACTAQNGAVSGGALGTLTYGQIVAQTTTFAVPDPTSWGSLPLTASTDFRFIGKDKTGASAVPFPRPDIADKVTGRARYGIDVNSDVDPALAGMKHAVVVHAPTIGSAVSGFTTPSGAKVFKLWNHSLVKTLSTGFYDPTSIVYNAIGVVDMNATMSNTWSASQLAAAAKPSWTASPLAASVDTTAIFNKGLQLVNAADDATIASLGSARQIIGQSAVPPESATPAVFIDQTYTLPFLAHTPMEPPCCTVLVTGTSAATYACKIWVSTQSQTACVDTAQKVLAFGQTTVAPTAIPVTVTTMMLGGGLGRKLETDFISQAVQIAKQMPGVPVKLTWLRPEDVRNDRFRPCAQIRVRLGLAADGALSLIYRNVSPSVKRYKGTPYNAATPSTADAGAVAGVAEPVPGSSPTTYAPPYPCAAYRIEYLDNPEDIPIGYWRSVGEGYNTFAMECAIDEVWLAGKNAGLPVAADPLQFRMNLLASDQRAVNVLKEMQSLLVAAGAPALGRARGLAFMEGFGSYVAMASEISLDATTKKPIVHRVFTVVDCGTAVNPDAVRAQVEGGVVYGLSAILWGQITATNGKVAQSNFNNYRVMKLKETPVFTTSIINSGGPIGGIGELPVPVVGPSVANAYAVLAGDRNLARTLPWYPGATMGGL